MLEDEKMETDTVNAMDPKSTDPPPPPLRNLLEFASSDGGSERLDYRVGDGKN